MRGKRARRNPGKKPWKNATERKQRAQDILMQSALTGFTSIYESGEYTEEQSEELSAEMSVQLGRIEKLFGYTVGSWMRS